MCRVCIDTTVFKNYSKHKDILINFLKEVAYKFAYEGEKHLIPHTFYSFVDFISEDDLPFDKFLEIKEKYPDLHDGEICLITYSIENNCCFLSDDKRARKRATQENIHPCCVKNCKVGGSIGILLFLRDILKCISEKEAKEIYEIMRTENWLPPSINLDKQSLETC